MRDEFMITRQGKQFVLYAGLLDEAHRKGLRNIETELLQVPSAENGNVAIVRATAKVSLFDGPESPLKSFTGIGDASPENVGRMIAPHAIRMAETRAKARALRDAINVGATSLEELGPEESGDEAPDPKQILIRIVGRRRGEFEEKHGSIDEMDEGKAQEHVERLNAVRSQRG